MQAGKSVIIENPVFNSPFDELRRRFKFDDDGVTDQIVQARRISSYFIPIAQPKKRAQVSTTRPLWVPTVNSAGIWGRWGFVEISDPWDAKKTILGVLKQEKE